MVSCKNPILFFDLNTNDDNFDSQKDLNIVI